jgi:hypothetical protein
LDVPEIKNIHKDIYIQNTRLESFYVGQRTLNPHHLWGNDQVLTNLVALYESNQWPDKCEDSNQLYWFNFLCPEITDKPNH